MARLLIRLLPVCVTVCRPLVMGVATLMILVVLGLAMSPCTQNIVSGLHTALCLVMVSIDIVPGTFPVYRAALLTGLIVMLMLGFALLLMVLLPNSTGVLLPLFLLTMMALPTEISLTNRCTVPIVVRLVLPPLL